MNEELTKAMQSATELTNAMQSATLATQHLQAALRTADAVTALVLLPMIADAARLAQQIGVLIHAGPTVRARMLSQRLK